MADVKKGPDEVDTATWLTCAEASDLLHVSEGSIRAWARGGKLHPIRGRRVLASGRESMLELYDPHELAPFGRRRKMASVPNDVGETAARAFELFDNGRSLRQVVVALRETPAKVSELHDQWYDLGGCEMVIGQTARVELERFLGPFEDVAALVAAVSRRLGSEIEIVLSEAVPEEAHARLGAMTDAQVEQRLVETFLGDAGPVDANPGSAP